MNLPGTIDKGLLLEDTGKLLGWSDWLHGLVQRNGAKVRRTEDRVIVEWGRHSVLGGLELNLTTTYLAPLLPFFLRRFRSVSHWVNGDQKAFEDFDRIADHLVKVIGEPIEKKGDVRKDREKSWVWWVGSTKLNLYLFEQHAFKLAFTITHYSNQK